MGIHHLLLSEAEAQMRAAQASVLRKADAATRRKLGGFDLPNGARDHRAKAVALLLGDGGLQILNLDQPLAYEDHEADVGFSGDPGITDELGARTAVLTIQLNPRHRQL